MVQGESNESKSSIIMRISFEWLANQTTRVIEAPGQQSLYLNVQTQSRATTYTSTNPPHESLPPREAIPNPYSYPHLPENLAQCLLAPAQGPAGIQRGSPLRAD